MSADRTSGGMAARVAVEGDWVEIVRTVFAPHERLEATPDDTRSLPYEARIRGFALSGGRIGDAIPIRTRIGRRLSGRLVAVDPAFSHGFGPSVPELLWIGPAMRARLFGVGPASKAETPVR